MSRDSWETPQPVFEALDREFRFGHDVCAEHATAKCPVYWTIEDDALSKDWAKECDNLFGYYCWCNPPYSKIGPWVDKAIECQKNGVGVVMLVMANTSSQWFAKAAESASEVRMVVNGRLSFLKGGERQSGNTHGSVIFVFDPFRIGTSHVSFVNRDDLYKI